MELKGSSFTLRPWRLDDAESLVTHADNPRVAQNLGDAFPSPYTLADAREWLEARALEEPPLAHLTIEVGGLAAGGIGVILNDGPKRISAELGYWVGEAHWGRGIGNEAVRLMTEYAFDTFGLRRLEARVYPWNPRSMRVLKRNGFVYETRLRNIQLKGGEPVDMLLFAVVR
jgi:RimJ/RimL family protein N-acetyltransferase